MVVLNTLRSLLMGFAFAALSSSAFAQEGGAFPNGATSLQEAYQDWLVSCAITDAGKQCALSQQQAQENGQRILAVELVVAADGAVSGSLVLPFGLALDAGVALQVDEQVALPPLRFSTCFPVGCLVRLNLDQQLLTELRGGTALTIDVTVDGTNQPAALSVSLKGFAAALDRTQLLSQ